MVLFAVWGLLHWGSVSALRLLIEESCWVVDPGKWNTYESFFFGDGCWNDLASLGMLFAGIDYSWQKTVRWSDQFSNCPTSSLESLRVKCLQLSSAPISMLGFSKRVGVPRITIEFKDQLASSIDSMSFLHIFYRWIQPMSFFLALGLHAKTPWWLMQEENYPVNTPCKRYHTQTPTYCWWKKSCTTWDV